MNTNPSNSKQLDRIMTMLSKGCTPYIKMNVNYGGISDLVLSITEKYPFRHFQTELPQESSYKVKNAYPIEYDGFEFVLVNVFEKNATHIMQIFGGDHVIESIFAVVEDPLFDKYLDEDEKFTLKLSYYEWLVIAARTTKNIPSLPEFNKILPIYVVSCQDLQRTNRISSEGLPQ